MAIAGVKIREKNWESRGRNEELRIKCQEAGARTGK